MSSLHAPCIKPKTIHHSVDSPILLRTSNSHINIKEISTNVVYEKAGLVTVLTKDVKTCNNDIAVKFFVLFFWPKSSTVFEIFEKFNNLPEVNRTEDAHV